MSSLPARLALDQLCEQARSVMSRSVLEQWKRTIEGLLCVERDRRVAEYQQRGEQVNRHRFRSNEVRLWPSVIGYNLENLWRRLALPRKIGNWSLTSLQQRLGIGVSKRAGLEAVSSPRELTERPKRTAMPPQRGHDVLSLTRQGSRHIIVLRGEVAVGNSGFSEVLTMAGIILFRF